MIKTRVFDPANYLDSDEAIAEYLALCLEDPNPDVFLAAIGDAARARGMTQLAKDTGLRRESLYKTFKPGKRPEFATVQKVLEALGLSLTIAPAETK